MSKVENPYKKGIYGVGVNDSETPVYWYEGLVKKKCPYYQRWSHMLERCFSKKYQLNHPSYKGCTVCDEWLYFSNFRAWMEKQDWEGKHLDKDLLVEDNKVYSPETCLFISKALNCSLNMNKVTDQVLPIGVSLNSRRTWYRCQCAQGEGSNRPVRFKGYFKDPLDAHRAWQLAKISRLNTLREEEGNISAKAVLKNIIGNLQYEYNNNIETVSLIRGEL